MSPEAVAALHATNVKLIREWTTFERTVRRIATSNLGRTYAIEQARAAAHAAEVRASVDRDTEIKLLRMSMYGAAKIAREEGWAWMREANEIRRAIRAVEGERS